MIGSKFKIELPAIVIGAVTMADAANIVLLSVNDGKVLSGGGGGGGGGGAGMCTVVAVCDC